VYYRYYLRQRGYIAVLGLIRLTDWCSYIFFQEIKERRTAQHKDDQNAGLRAAFSLLYNEYAIKCRAVYLCRRCGWCVYRRRVVRWMQRRDRSSRTSAWRLRSTQSSAAATEAVDSRDGRGGQQETAQGGHAIPDEQY